MQIDRKNGDSSKGKNNKQPDWSAPCGSFWVFFNSKIAIENPII